MAEAAAWIDAQPKLANGKVDARLLIAESVRRGYCVCPKPMRQIINVDGLTCAWCDQKETRQSWEFWYGEGK
jgi:hypothetical protein